MSLRKGRALMPLIRSVDPATGVVNYRQDPPDPSKPVMLTGPVRGPVTLTDGTTYDVTEAYVEVASPEHAGELDHHIGVRHETDGHPDHVRRGTEGYDPLVHEYDHVCTAACGPAERSDEEADAAWAARLTRLGGPSKGKAYDDSRAELARLRGVARGEREI